MQSTLTITNPLAGFKDAAFNQHRLPRGCHPLDALTITRTPTGGPPTYNKPVSQNVGDAWVIDISATFTEALFLSPFLFHSKKKNEAGLLGINAMNFVFNIDAQMRRFWSSGFQKVNGNNAIPYTLSLNQANGFPIISIGCITITSAKSTIHQCND